LKAIVVAYALIVAAPSIGFAQYGCVMGQFDCTGGAKPIDQEFRERDEAIRLWYQQGKINQHKNELDQMRRDEQMLKARIAHQKRMQRLQRELGGR
jgi:Skp family chaperone for outer membrane proteins